MKSKILTFLIALTSGVVSASTTSKVGTVELKFGNEVIMNEIGGVAADTPDQLETMVRTYLRWEPEYAREFSHIPFNSPEAQEYRKDFLEVHRELKNKLKKEIPSNVNNPRTLEKIQNSLVEWGWPEQAAKEFLHMPLSSREARLYRRKFMDKHPDLPRVIKNSSPSRVPTKSRPVSPGLSQRMKSIEDAEAGSTARWQDLIRRSEARKRATQ